MAEADYGHLIRGGLGNDLIGPLANLDSGLRYGVSIYGDEGDDRIEAFPGISA